MKKSRIKKYPIESAKKLSEANNKSQTEKIEYLETIRYTKHYKQKKEMAKAKTYT